MSAPSSTPTSRQAIYSKFKSEESVVLGDSPSKIKGNFQALFNYFNKFYGELASVKYVYTKIPMSFLESLASYETPVKNAANAITAYLRKSCGVS